jgi:hypothetical protein
MSYPSVLKYYLEKLDNVSRKTFLLYPQTPVQANAGDTISITLPENSIVNLDAFTVYANLTTGAGTTAPRNVESLIDQVTVLVNGIAVAPGAQMTNYLSTALIDFYGSDKQTQRSLLQLGADVVQPATNATAGLSTPIAISHFLGFLSSAQPRYLDTSILGSVRLQIKLAGTNVLVSAGAGSTLTWQLDTIQALCQVVSIDDGSYSQIVQQRLSNGGVKIPFKYYLTFQRNVGIAGQNLRMNVSSQSVDGVWATFQQALTGTTSYTANGYDSQLRSSTYFTRCASNMVDSVFSVNGVRFPSIPLTSAQIWNENMHNLGLSCDMVGQMDKSFMNSTYTAGSQLASGTYAYTPASSTISPGVDKFQSNAFFHYFKFNVDNDEGTSRLSSGLDTRGSASTLTWQTTGSSGTLLPVCYVECTGIMEVGPSRQISIVW